MPNDAKEIKKVEEPQDTCPNCGKAVRSDMRQCSHYGCPLCDD